MFAQKMGVLGYVPVIEIGYTKIEYDIKYIRKIEKGEIGTKLSRANKVLHLPIDKKYPEGLNR